MNFKTFLIENEEQDDVRKTIKKLPKSHQKLLKGYKFRFQPKNTLKGDHDHVGENNEKTKIITICAPWNYGREFILLHEIGHLIWDNLMSNDQQKKWKQIYKKTKMIKKDRQSAEEIWCHAYAASYVERPPMAYYKPEWVKIIKSV